jgi:hypothetical protein
MRFSISRILIIGATQQSINLRDPDIEVKIQFVSMQKTGFALAAQNLAEPKQRMHFPYVFS